MQLGAASAAALLVLAATALVAPTAAADACMFRAGDSLLGIKECRYGGGATMYTAWLAGRPVAAIAWTGDGALVCDPQPTGWTCAGAESYSSGRAGDDYTCAYAGVHSLCVHRTPDAPRDVEVLWDGEPVRESVYLGSPYVG